MFINDRAEKHFSFMSAYFVDAFYNHFYSQAKQLKNNNKFTTITDAYKNVVFIYKTSMEKKVEYIKQTLTSMHEDYIVRSHQDTITFTAWLDIVFQNFIPQQLIETINTNQKTAIISSVIKEIINKLAVKMVTSQYLHLIIDERTPESAAFLANEAMEIIIFVREDTFQKFINPKGDKSAGVSLEVAKKLKETIKKLSEENVKYRIMVKKMHNMIQEKDDMLKTQIHEIEKLKIINSELVNPANEELNKMKRMENEIHELKNLMKQSLQQQSNLNPNTHSNPNSNTHSNPNSNTDNFTKQHNQFNSNTNTHSNSNLNSNTNNHSGTNTYSNVNVNSNTNSNSNNSGNVLQLDNPTSQFKNLNVHYEDEMMNMDDISFDNIVEENEPISKTIENKVNDSLLQHSIDELKNVGNEAKKLEAEINEDQKSTTSFNKVKNYMEQQSNSYDNAFNEDDLMRWDS